MLRWGNLDDTAMYVLDLIQLPSGVRGVRLRTPHDPQHEYAVLRSKPYCGARLKQFGKERFYSAEIETTDGRQFGLDPHDIWMTKEEAEYWRMNHTEAALKSPNAPWVNQLPPKLAPK